MKKLMHFIYLLPKKKRTHIWYSPIRLRNIVFVHSLTLVTRTFGGVLLSSRIDLEIPELIVRDLSRSSTHTLISSKKICNEVYMNLVELKFLSFIRITILNILHWIQYFDYIELFKCLWKFGLVSWSQLENKLH